MATHTFAEDLHLLRLAVTRYFPDLVDELEMALAVCASLKIKNQSPNYQKVSSDIRLVLCIVMGEFQRFPIFPHVPLYI